MKLGVNLCIRSEWGLFQRPRWHFEDQFDSPNMPRRWNCVIAGCTASWRNWSRYHCVPRSKEILSFYKAFSKTDGVDWMQRKYICSKHWTTQRKNFKHLPDIRSPWKKRDAAKVTREKEREERRKKFERIRKITQRAKERLCKGVKLAVQIEENDESTNNYNTSSDGLITSTQLQLERENLQLERENQNLKAEIAALRVELDTLRSKTYQQMPPQHRPLPVFDWDQLSNREIEQFTGFSHAELATLFKCFEPYLHLIKYESCANSMSDRRKTTKNNEFLAVMAICRHALPLSIVAWMLRVSQTTLSRIFEAWVTFGDAVLSCIDIQPSHDLISKMMPPVFKKLGYGYVTLVLDATEFKVGRFSDLNINTLFYSDYKQSHTVKGLVCLAPHGALVKVPDLFPGSITDTAITEATGALDRCQVLDGVITDKGFAISELAAEKGAEHNRPPMKSDGQFTEGQCADNFNIACLRIHVERWIGYLRNFRILNTVWPCGRIDLLNSVWRFLAHIQAMSSLVGPKQDNRETS